MAKSLFEQIVDRSVTTITKNDLIDITNIEDNVFEECTALTSITIPSSVTSIGNFAFFDCNKLVNLELEVGLIDIGVSAFRNCESLITVTIPSSVKSIGGTVFCNSNGAMNIANAYFNQPLGMEVTLPTAGMAGGMFYVKTARNMNVYTDNETIKNYDWASDNITPTFYHLDGTAW